MAKDTKNANPANSADDQQTQQKKRKKLIIIIVAVVLLLSVSAGITLTLLNSSPATDATAGEVATETAQDSAKKPAIYYELKPAFVVNFQDKNRIRYLQAELTLLIRDLDVAPALDMHMPLIRNNLVLLLSGQKFEELQTPEGKEALRQQTLLSVQEVLQAELGKPGVEQVLFVSFVMQ